MSDIEDKIEQAKKLKPKYRDRAEWNKRVEILFRNWKKKTLKEISNELDLTRERVRQEMEMLREKNIEMPPKRETKTMVNKVYMGELDDYYSWDEVLEDAHDSLNKNTIKSRFKRGWSKEEALRYPRGVSKDTAYKHEDEWKSLVQIAKETGIKRTTLRKRIKRMGLSLDEAINYSKDKKRNTDVYKKKIKGKTLDEWKNDIGCEPDISEQAIWYRIEKGWDIEDAIKTPAYEQPNKKSNEN